LNWIINIVSFIRKPVICYFILITLIMFLYIFYLKYSNNIKSFLNPLKKSNLYYYTFNTLVLIGSLLCIYVLRKPLLGEFKWLYIFSIITLLICLFTNLNNRIYLPLIFIIQTFSFELTLGPQYYITSYGTIISSINILIIGIILYFLCNWQKLDKIFTSIFSFLFSLIYISQLYYSYFFFDIYSINMLGSAGNTFSVLDSILELTNSTIVLIFLITIMNQILIFRKR